MNNMNVTFAPNGILQIDNARIIFRNFSGLPSKYNREGDRNFALVIPDRELADKLANDKNGYGVGWNVKIKPPRDEDEEPYMFLPVKLKFNSRGPSVYLVSGNNRVKLDEETISRLDKVEILNVNLDIRPYDDIINEKPFRSAYVQAMEVNQRTDRFSERE